MKDNVEIKLALVMKKKRIISILMILKVKMIKIFVLYLSKQPKKFLKRISISKPVMEDKNKSIKIPQLPGKVKTSR